MLHSSVCDPQLHFSRRTLLGAGAGGAMLSAIANRLAWADQIAKTDAGEQKNVILLWMDGGPSQLETFDPHVGSKYGGDVGAIPTTVKGLEIADTLPQTAEKMHLGTLIRSMTSKEGDHQRATYNVKTGWRLDPTLVHPSIGAVLCHEFPQSLDIPRHVSIIPGQWPSKGGYLGPNFDAFIVGDPNSPVPDLKARVDADRMDRRLSGLDFLESQFRRGRLKDLDHNRTLHQSSTAAALRMMSSEQIDAFDVSDESATTLASFGDTPFGRGCLAASRLIEAGVRCVEVNLSGWDTHVNNHSLQSSACGTLDPALASLLGRLEEREMLRNTLVVCGGEFGRTPVINPAGGRDHWPNGFSMFLAGCGIRRGSVYGATAADPVVKSEDLKSNPLVNLDQPVTIGDLHATILKCLGVAYERELETPVGRPLVRIEGDPIDELMV
ncbi:DUF1501 domain-containing protein [Roseiconus lacunae]|uniref:DUF1501 domain-containing protein n=1 Tax=Roseiconus lacunae TaxID=2605694 RepID=A0ABT7PP97_9BACT|nr:DUF1501 domain-containing protein [Roseiconus lacunae]MDM4018330.1 DUF1501 domain-containing protein [Roseiconus lacunae]